MIRASLADERECPEEAEAQAPCGPGRVSDGEELGRLLFRECYLTPDGFLAPAALPTADLIEPQRKGLSVARLAHLSDNELRRQIAVRERRNPKNRFIGMGIAMTSGVRSLRTADGRREVCVVDDPLKGYCSHALLRLANAGTYSPGSVRRIRERLIELFAFRSVPAPLNPATPT